MELPVSKMRVLANGTKMPELLAFYRLEIGERPLSSTDSKLVLLT